jgi:hypothetical protein
VKHVLSLALLACSCIVHTRAAERLLAQVAAVVSHNSVHLACCLQCTNWCLLSPNACLNNVAHTHTPFVLGDLLPFLLTLPAVKNSTLALRSECPQSCAAGIQQQYSCGPCVPGNLHIMLVYRRGTPSAALRHHPTFERHPAIALYVSFTHAQVVHVCCQSQPGVCNRCSLARPSYHPASAYACIRCATGLDVSTQATVSAFVTAVILCYYCYL